ncbi:NAD-dependent epimerase/dehydratase family protein [Candidatus Formimonas warabiya]|nr:NAD(P)-dependent oxidoreductase [Candidatus Formimonas warabiya]
MAEKEMHPNEPIKKAIITGATGYIGFHLTRRLLQLGWQVAVIKRPSSSIGKLERYKGNVEFFDYNCSTESLKQAMDVFRPDIIFHLASCVIARHKTEQIENLINSNVLFGTLLLEAMHLSGVDKIVNASTAWQTAGGCDYKPFSLYAATKQAFEDILQFYSNVYGIKSISLRLPDTYGPDDSRSKILNLVHRAAQSGEPLKMSAGEQEMDLLYIDDVLNGFIKGAELLQTTSEKCSIYSLSSRNPMRLRKIVELYEAVNGVSVNIEWGALPYRDNEIMKGAVPNNVLPSWKSKVTLEDGLRNLSLCQEDVNSI